MWYRGSTSRDPQAALPTGRSPSTMTGLVHPNAFKRSGGVLTANPGPLEDILLDDAWVKFLKLKTRNTKDKKEAGKKYLKKTNFIRLSPRLQAAAL